MASALDDRGVPVKEVGPIADFANTVVFGGLLNKSSTGAGSYVVSCTLPPQASVVSIYYTER
jgi:hypothetical protein